MSCAAERLAERLDQRLQCRRTVRRERRLIYSVMDPKIDNVRPVLEEPGPYTVANTGLKQLIIIPPLRRSTASGMHSRTRSNLRFWTVSSIGL